MDTESIDTERHRSFNIFKWHRHAEKSNADDVNSEEEEEEEEDVEVDDENSTIDYYLDPSTKKNEAIEDDQINLRKSFNLIKLINVLFVKLANLLDHAIPTDSKFRNLVLLQLLGIIDFARGRFTNYKTDCQIGGAPIILFIVLIVAILPFLTINIIMIIGYTTFTSTVFYMGLSILILFSSIGFLPIFLVFMTLIILAASITFIAYLTISYTYDFIITTKLTRSIITSIADRVPPSVGSDEVAISTTPESKKVPKVEEIIAEDTDKDGTVAATVIVDQPNVSVEPTEVNDTVNPPNRSE